MTKHNRGIFGVSFFFKLQNSKQAVKNETWDTYLLAVEPFYYVLENNIIKQLNQKQMSTIRLIFHHLTVNCCLGLVL